MKQLCKICPQLALCLLRNPLHNPSPLERNFYPQQIETYRKTETVFRCYTPEPTGEPDGFWDNCYVIRVPRQEQ